MDTENTQGVNEPSPASAGSRPFAWAADIPGKFGAAPTVLFGYTEKLVQRIAAAGGDAVQPFPLYRHPQPTLTDEEREAIREAVGAYNDNDDDEECAKIAATLYGLLKRLG
jgi:hypothetical protein